MTSTKLVQDEVVRFLSTNDPEVLCVSGDWGVGKTYTWQLLLDQTVRDKTLELNRYSYVSLFGINSLEELKLSIFENSDTFNPEAGYGRIKEKVQALLSKMKKSRSVAEELPKVGKWLKAAGPLFFKTVHDQIICIDDLDRCGDGLKVKDVLGLVSFLKEQRTCKVAIVFALLFCVGSGISFAAEKLEKPEDFSYRLTNEQILENYLKIAFGNEFGLNKNRKRDLIVKWQENIKPFTFSLAPDSKEIIFIEDILSEVLDITGVKLGHFSEQTDANFIIAAIESTKEIIVGLNKGWLLPKDVVENSIRQNNYLTLQIFKLFRRLQNTVLFYLHIQPWARLSLPYCFFQKMVP